MTGIKKLLDGDLSSLPVETILKYFRKGSNNKDEEKSRIDQDVKRLGGPFKPIPNVREFRVELSNGDRLFLLFGITKRASEPKLIYKPHCNKRLNRYMEHQLKRLDRLARLPLSRERKSKIYGAIMGHLIKRSNIYLTMAINHVFPKGHREMSLSGVIRLAIETRRLANTDNEKLPKLDFRRVYIPKGDNKVRPLGVPTPAGRIYLHMINQALVHYQGKFGYLHESQHGFRPGRGTGTAWKEILTKVIHAKDIFEFDLKQFFPSVNLDFIDERLKQQYIPTEIRERLYYINSIGCLVADDSKYHRAPYGMNEVEEKIKDLFHKGASFREIIDHERPLSYNYRIRGLPQGAPTSPALSLIALEGSILDRNKGVYEHKRIRRSLGWVINNDIRYEAGEWQGEQTSRSLEIPTVMYADDGIYYGDLEGIPLITPNSDQISGNIRFNLEKSDGVKRNGEGLKPLKFLGLEYNGIENKLYAKTRKGSELEYDKEELLQMLDYRDRVSFDPKAVAPKSMKYVLSNGDIWKIGITKHIESYGVRGELSGEPLEVRNYEELRKGGETSEMATSLSPLIFNDYVIKYYPIFPKELKEIIRDYNKESTQGGKPEEKSPLQPSGEEFIKSKYYGGVVSRLYFGTGEINSDYGQSFEYKYIPRSGAALKGTDLKINVFNSTSYASEGLVRKLDTLSFMRPKLAKRAKANN